VVNGQQQLFTHDLWPGAVPLSVADLLVPKRERPAYRLAQHLGLLPVDLNGGLLVVYIERGEVELKEVVRPRHDVGHVVEVDADFWEVNPLGHAGHCSRAFCCAGGYNAPAAYLFRRSFEMTRYVLPALMLTSAVGLFIAAALARYAGPIFICAGVIMLIGAVFAMRRLGHA
jgi:hypothetical protein